MEIGDITTKFFSRMTPEKVGHPVKKSGVENNPANCTVYENETRTKDPVAYLDYYPSPGRDRDKNSCSSPH